MVIPLTVRAYLSSRQWYCPTGKARRNQLGAGRFNDDDCQRTTCGICRSNKGAALMRAVSMHDAPDHRVLARLIGSIEGRQLRAASAPARETDRVPIDLLAEFRWAVRRSPSLGARANADRRRITSHRRQSRSCPGARRVATDHARGQLSKAVRSGGVPLITSCWSALVHCSIGGGFAR